MPKIQIIIPCINLWFKYTKPCIDSIKTKYDYRILLIDNGSTDETKIEAGKLVSNIFSHHRNEEPWSCAKSWNFGIKDAFERGYEYALVLNNDILLHPEAINKMVERFEKDNNDLAIVSCMDIKGELDKPMYIFDYMLSNKKDIKESEHPNFSAFMINKESYERIGEFDESFKPAYFEDNDYHYRIKLLKMKAICLPTALFYHFGSATQNEAFDKPLVGGMKFEMNRNYYISKWGDVPGKETYLKPFNEA